MPALDLVAFGVLEILSCLILTVVSIVLLVLRRKRLSQYKILTPSRPKISQWKVEELILLHVTVYAPLGLGVGISLLSLSTRMMRETETLLTTFFYIICIGFQYAVVKSLLVSLLYRWVTVHYSSAIGGKNMKAVKILAVALHVSAIGGGAVEVIFELCALYFTGINATIRILKAVITIVYGTAFFVLVTAAIIGCSVKYKDASTLTKHLSASKKMTATVVIYLVMTVISFYGDYIIVWIFDAGDAMQRTPLLIGQFVFNFVIDVVAVIVALMGTLLTENIFLDSGVLDEENEESEAAPLKLPAIITYEQRSFDDDINAEPEFMYRSQQPSHQSVFHSANVDVNDIRFTHKGSSDSDVARGYGSGSNIANNNDGSDATVLVGSYQNSTFVN